MRRGDWMQIASGRAFWPFDPAPTDIEIRDVAHALSNLCRFGGHCRTYYSVAEHSVRVSRIVPERDRLWALLHDASEAYLVDLPRPIKRAPMFDGYRDLEAGLMKVVCTRFGLPEEMPETVHTADNVLLATEARDLMGVADAGREWHLGVDALPDIIEPWSPTEARAQFLATFRELVAQKKGARP